ncbi:hypothetical protein ACHSBP_21305 [Pseudoalteromonas sp. XMcav1-K]|uniref:hypothetical protein n=1 Tax=Pseudoalteromonas sp. XMcav1-K TaxID=3374372 RepID=UPI0037566A8C
MENKKIKVLAIVPGYIPSVILGVLYPLLELKKRGRITFDAVNTGRVMAGGIDFSRYDVAVFCRHTELDDLRIVNQLKLFNIPYVYEFDDNFYRIPTGSPIGEYHRCPKRLYALRYLQKNASAVRCYSKKIASDLNKIGVPHISLNRPYFDFELLDKIKKTARRKNSDNNVVHIAFATSRSDDEIVNKYVVPALIQILNKYPEKIKVTLFGNIRLPTLTKVGGKRVETIKFNKSYREFLASFIKQKIDIGLAPLSNGDFENSKTDNKFREYSGCRAAGIYSDVELYKNSVEHNHTGVLVENSIDAWFKGIEELVLNSELRGSIIDRAEVVSRRRYQKDNYIDEWESNLKAVLEKSYAKQALFEQEPRKGKIVHLFANHKSSLQLAVSQKLDLILRDNELLNYKGYVDIAKINELHSCKGTFAVMLCTSEKEIDKLLFLSKKSSIEKALVIAPNSFKNRFKNILNDISFIGFDDSIIAVEKTNRKNKTVFNIDSAETMSELDYLLNMEREIFDNNFYIAFLDKLKAHNVLGFPALESRVKQPFLLSKFTFISRLFNFVTSVISVVEAKIIEFKLNRLGRL